jgi:hypothetical protein
MNTIGLLEGIQRWVTHLMRPINEIFIQSTLWESLSIDGIIHYIG